MDRRSNVAHKARRQRGHVLPDERLMTQRPTADGDAWKERLSDAHLCLRRLVSLGRPHHATWRDAERVELGPNRRRKSAGRVEGTLAELQV